MPAINPVFPIPVTALLVLLPALWLLIRTVKGRKPSPRWLLAPIVALRLAALVLLGWLLLNPVEPVSRPVPDFDTLVLVDRSASMGLGPGKGESRLQEAAVWVEELRAEAGRLGIEAPRVRGFADGLDDETSGGVEGMTADGVATRLAGALEEIAGLADVPDHVHVLSDGCIQDRSDLSAALGLLRAGGTVISTRTLGSDTPPRNAWISRVESPRIVRAGARVQVAATVMATGVADDTRLMLSLNDADGALIESRQFVAGGEMTQSFEFDAALRTADYTLELAPVPGETTRRDNVSRFNIEISSKKLRVLFVDGTHHKRPIGNTGLHVNDLELMTMAFDAAGDIEYLCLTCPDQYLQAPNLFQVSFHNGEMLLNRNVTFPTTREELFSYDVMIISDVPVGNFSKDQLQWVVDWVVERGAGFLMGGGYTTFDTGNYDKTVWEKIIPADMKAYGEGFVEEPFKMSIPKEARGHPIWHFSDDTAENDRILDSHPDWRGMVRIRRVKPGALVLAVRPDTGNEPLIAVQSYGRGRSIAYMPDPNGGWAYHFTKWAPPGKELVGERISLGTGASFRFNAERSVPPPGVVLKEHPSPYYGRFWVNVVRWLGENSIRWKRDKLAGRSLAATASPGGSLPVAAEVLAVNDAAALLQLDVGARLDRPGSPRVALTYDRDRREFVGRVPVPEDLTGESVGLVFDAAVEGVTHSDLVPVTVLATNREFAETRPDRRVMEEIAVAGGGRHFRTTRETAEAIADEARRSATTTLEGWQRPLWTRWQWWAAIAALLCLEWYLRRRGHSYSSVIPVQPN